MHDSTSTPVRHASISSLTHAAAAITVLLFAALVWLGAAPHVQAQDGLPKVVITEIHYKPDIKTERVEFVELYNISGGTVDLSDWALDGGIEYFFPPGTTLDNREYLVIAESVPAFRTKFGFTPLGPYTGRLGSDNESLILRNTEADAVDRVEYTLGFPWPTVGFSPGRSMQLINPEFDNAQPGAWRSAAPTPGRTNDVDYAYAAPFVENVTHTPVSPRGGVPVVISARVDDPDGVARVTLLYQDVAPGAYIARSDAAYESEWNSLPMQRTDEDTLYQATLPAELNRHRHLIRYRVEVEDVLGYQVRVPYADDFQPNFAYFVYDGVPPWTGSQDGLPGNEAIFDFDAMRPLATYHLLAKSADVADAMFMPPSQEPAGYAGNEYPWYGTLVYDGVVYDHVGFRARGGLYRYATGKTSWKINFNLGHRFQARDNYFQPYSVEWDKLNLNSSMQHTNRGFRGEHGLFEAASYRLFNMAGVPAPTTHWVHWRVITDEAELGVDQYSGDFWGLYLAVEQMDSRFLEEHGLPDGNLYKIENFAGDKNNQGATATPTNDDVNDFIAKTLFAKPDNRWWRENLDLENYYSYRAVLESVYHYDVDQGKNYFYYFDPETGKVKVLPWDVDLTWSQSFFNAQATGAEPFFTGMLGRPEFNIEYQNRLRELRDLLFNRDQMQYLLRELSDVIDTPGDGNSMVDADRFRWDHHPIFETSYVMPKRTEAGDFYSVSPTEDFAGMVNLMRSWVDDRTAWIDQVLLTDPDHPYTPDVTYIGADDWAADALRFRSSSFNDPQGRDTFAAMEWRIAEVTNPEGPVYVPGARAHLEIYSVWESGELDEFQAEWTVPSGVVRPWHTYRVRVRLQDDSGRWSHWSHAYQFIARPPAEPPTANLRITELMYHPAHAGATEGDRLEFLELHNAGETVLELSNFHFTTGIDYRFPPQTFLEPGAYLILANEETPFERHHNREVFATYDRRLGNGGETLTLVDGYARPILTVTYDDEPPWPVAADGEGYSLVLISNRFDGSSPDHWRLSTARDGSPGAADPQPVLVNEILAGSSIGAGAVELYNPYVDAADISGWYLTDDLGQPAKYRFPAGSIVPPDGYLVVSGAALAAGQVSLSSEGGALYLAATRADGRLTSYRHGFDYPAIPAGHSLIRVQTSDGRAHLASTEIPTPGQPNAAAVVGPVVFSKILYRPLSGHELIELRNISSAPVPLYDPANPARVWEVDGILFPLPAGITLGPGEILRLVPNDPAQACLATAPDEPEAPKPRQIVGPYPAPLSDSGQELRLRRPAGNSSFYVVDQVFYRADAPWPEAAAKTGAALLRLDPPGFGSEPANWRAEAMATAAEVNTLGVTLCSFTADRPRETGIATIKWVVNAEQNVAGYRVWRSLTGDRAGATLLTEDVLPVQGVESVARLYTLTDAAAAPDTTYWLEAVGTDDSTQDIAFTRLRTDFLEVFLPFVTKR